MDLHENKIVGKARKAYSHSDQLLYPMTDPEAKYPAYDLEEIKTIIPKPLEVFGYTYNVTIKEGENVYSIRIENSQASADDIPLVCYTANPAEELARVLLTFKEYEDQYNESQFLMNLYRAISSNKRK